MTDPLLQHWASISRCDYLERGNHVYFASCDGHLDLVKIGWTSRPTRNRIAALQAGCPTRLKALLTFPGENELERLMHGRFHKVRSHCEWFHVRDELRELVDMCWSLEFRRRRRRLRADAMAQLRAQQIGAVIDLLGPGVVPGLDS